MKPPPIITAPEWGARPAKAPAVWAPRPHRIIFHHTAGHHPEISRPQNESREEACRYARDTQAFHMAPGGLGVPQGGNDSGHNFLVCRNGLILVGRRHSLTAVAQGRMIVSAHCPGQNEQPGIEHEQLGNEPMTAAQFRASVWLHAWIIERCKMAGASVIRPHGEFFPTSCPGVLVHDLPVLRSRVATLLTREGL